jgi:type II secretory pathway component PulJ
MNRKAFTLLEVTIVSGLMALLAVVLSSAWVGLGRPVVDLIERTQLLQEMNLAVAALSRDLGGSLADPDGRLGDKNAYRWVGWMEPKNSGLWLCFDDPEGNGEPDWEPPDVVIVYQLQADALVRSNQASGESFLVAKHIERMQVLPAGNDAIRIRLTFKYRTLSRQCTLVVRTP